MKNCRKQFGKNRGLNFFQRLTTHNQLVADANTRWAVVPEDGLKDLRIRTYGGLGIKKGMPCHRLNRRS